MFIYLILISQYTTLIEISTKAKQRSTKIYCKNFGVSKVESNSLPFINWKVYFVFFIMIRMDEELQRILKIRPLQIKCAAYSTATNEYRKILKLTYSNECRKLINVEIAIDKENLKIPAKERLPPIPDIISDKDPMDALLAETFAVQEALQLLN